LSGGYARTMLINAMFEMKLKIVATTSIGKR
jgi:hypothetical protein